MRGSVAVAPTGASPPSVDGATATVDAVMRGSHRSNAKTIDAWKQPMARAAASIDAWKVVSQMLPLPVACVADAWLGRYRAIVLASVLFVVSTGTLSLSLSSSFHIFRSGGHVAVFYVALYLVALGEGTHKLCAQAFAADQFDEKDPKENVARSSFFNWWYFHMCAGTVVTTMVSSYVQDSVGCGLGFGIPCIVIVIVVSLAVFLIGSPSYRDYTTKEPSPVARVGKALLVLIKSWRSKHRTKLIRGLLFCGSGTHFGYNIMGRKNI